ncbi:MAG TPA: sulfite exporter TauE/SafE family protein, partial [Dongiaceae bacterium]|nr:sulfite exporter TauE/SafE family protein [Dongiaceae bacterium]
MANALDLVSLLASHCRVAVQDHGSVMLSLFATGLIGSFTHCTTMCGPLVAAQSVEVLGRMPAGRGGDLRRLAGAALVPYQLGRTTTYAGLGAMLALPIGFAHLLHQLWWVAPLLLMAAAIGFVLLALQRLGIALSPRHACAPSGSGVPQ